jgi:Fe2+ or Zn2+ uptake regulation protein
MTTLNDGGALLDALASAGVRVTEPRRAMAALIEGRDGHFTTAELVAAARDAYPGLGRATIFRALDLFTTLGLVERMDLPDGGHAWIACETAHHHHAICTRCGRSTEVDDHGLAEVLAEVAGRSGFRVATHRLEIFGTCAACLAGAAS